MRQPTPAVQLLWQARIVAELKKGTAPEQTTAIFNQMMECWQAVKDNAEDGFGATLKPKHGLLIV